MNIMRKKLGKNGGFTLIEMLVVVGIIAILVAVSIPLISNALERARDATDQANERAAKAEAVLVYMGLTSLGNTPNYEGGPFGTDADAPYDGPYYYDAKSGKIVEGSTPEPYGKCTGNNCTAEYIAADTHDEGGHEGGYLQVSADNNGAITLDWVGM